MKSPVLFVLGIAFIALVLVALWYLLHSVGVGHPWALLIVLIAGVGACIIGWRQSGGL